MNPQLTIPEEEAIWYHLSTIPDPEIPVVSLVDLGMIRGIERHQNHLVIQLSPTYNGCPALEMIQQQIRLELEGAFEIPVEVQLVLDPPWTTDWISEDGKEKLREFGIAPPVRRIQADHWRAPSSPVSCPHCGSSATEAVSEFGSTPCKALYRCTACLEPFDYFKCH